MKVLNISQSFKIVGGSDVYFHSLTELLQKNEIQVDEFASVENKSDTFPKSVDFNKPNLKDVIKYIYNSEAERKLASLISKNKYDIAHIHIYYGQLTSSILAPLKQKSIPVVQTLHEYKLVCATYKHIRNNTLCYECKNNKFYQCFFYKCNRDSYLRSALSVIESYVSLWLGSQDKIDHYITVSDFQKEEIRKMGYKRDNITTAHNFVSLSTYPVKYQEGDYVLYFGRLEKVKGVEHLLNVFEKLPVNVKLVIVGDGGYRAEMERRINDSDKFKKQIIYLGFKKAGELSQIIYKSKFVIQLSIETFGLTVIEAMGHFKPVIGSNIGGISEIISDGIDGFLVGPNNEAQIAERIMQLWKDEALIEQMGKAARRKVAEHFSPEAHFNKLKVIYSKYIPIS